MSVDTIEEKLKKEHQGEVDHQEMKIPENSVKKNRKMIILSIAAFVFVLLAVFSSFIGSCKPKSKTKAGLTDNDGYNIIEDTSKLNNSSQSFERAQSLMLGGIDEIRMNQQDLRMEQDAMRSRLRELEEKSLKPSPAYRNENYIDKYSMRFDPKYTQLNQYIKGNVSRAWKMSDADVAGLSKTSIARSLDTSLYSLHNNISLINPDNKFTIPSGYRIELISESEINSDHPGYVTAKVTTPVQLKGWRAILRQNGQLNDRIVVSIEKIINSSGLKEYAVNGQVEMDFPGLSGKVKNHFAKRIIPEIISTAFGAGYVAYETQRQLNDPRGDSSGMHIDSRDVYAGTVAQQTVNSLQSEARRFGGDVPNTVTVSQGERFFVLLTQTLTVDLL
ncbi:MAG: hypothetical protein GX640_04170 [Fibrobacter sp.]|nr:hypothetical protein [Fibrobacter sp.]